MKQYKTITVALTILWILSAAGAYIYYFIQYIMGKLPTALQVSGENLISFGIVILYLFPLMLLIKRYSKLAQMKTINRLANVLAWFLGAFSLLTPLAIWVAAL